MTWATCFLFDMTCSSFWCLHFSQTAWLCLQETSPNLYLIYGFGNKFFIFQKEWEYISMQIIAVFCECLARDTCACTALYHSSTDQFPCLKLVSRSNLALISFDCGLQKSSYFAHIVLPCLKLVSRSNLALTSFDCGLQKSSYFAHIVSKQRSSMDKHQETYWSIPKSPLHAMTFLHFFDSGNMASLQSRIISHFRFPTLKIYGRSLYSISNPSWALQ